MEEREKNIIQIIQGYFSNKWSNKQRHAFEKDLQKDPFLSDAVDGFSQFAMKDLTEDLQQLSLKIKQKTYNNNKSHFLKSRLKYAAIILLFIATGTLVLFQLKTNTKQNNIAQQQITDKALANKSLEPINIIKPEKNIAHKEIANDFLNNTTNEALELEKNKETKIKQTEKIVEQKKTIPKTSKTEKSVAFSKGSSTEIPNATKHEENKLSAVIIEEEEEVVDDEFIAYAVADDKISMAAIPESNSTPESRIIRGIVVDAASQQPVIGATIRVKNSKQASLSDINGKFEMELIDDSIIEIQYIGMSDLNVNINVRDTNNTRFELHADVFALNEVAVVGYGTRKKNAPANAKMNSKVDKKYSKSFSHVRFIYNTTYEKQAEPLPSYKAFNQYIRDNMQIKKDSTVEVESHIIIHKDGSVEYINSDDFDHTIYAEESKRLIETGKKWKPAKNNKLPIDQALTIIIIF